MNYNPKPKFELNQTVWVADLNWDNEYIYLGKGAIKCIISTTYGFSYKLENYIIEDAKDDTYPDLKMEDWIHPSREEAIKDMKGHMKMFLDGIIKTKTLEIGAHIKSQEKIM